jgi:hypothetical protein
MSSLFGSVKLEDEAQIRPKEESTRRREGVKKPPAMVLADKPQEAKAAN